MNYHIIRSFSIGIILSSMLMGVTYAVGAWSRIDMAVSPIRDEFTAFPNTPITRTVQYTNNSDVPYAIYMTVEDCEPSGDYGTPICKKQPDTWTPSQIYSSTWISINWETSFVVPPKSSKTIEYTVYVPPSAVPGGHYGAIFFNNPDTLDPGANAVGMIRRIGMLYMMKVPWHITMDTSLGDILIDEPQVDADLNSAPSIIDEILQKLWKWAPMWADIQKEINPLWDKPMLEKEDFNLVLKIPVKNDGNIHVRPTGKVYLYDENGTQLEKVWKQSIVDENWVYVWETIVDYLPINDERGSVLPNTERTFNINWLGFGYEERDPITGKMEIKFESPGSYYTRLTEQSGQFIYPWEKLAIRKMNRTLVAKVEFTYNDAVTGEDVTKTMDLPVSVSYTYIAKTLNYGMLVLVGFIVLFAWLFIRKRDRKIEKLEEVNEELYDEISVLEHAKKNIAVKKTSAKASTKKVTESKPSAPQKAQAKKEDTTTVAPKPTKKPAVTKKKTAPKVVPAKKEDTSPQA